MVALKVALPIVLALASAPAVADMSDAERRFYDQRIGDLERQVDRRFADQKEIGQVALATQKEALQAALVAAKEAIAAALVSVKETAAAFSAQTQQHFAAINGLQAKLDKQAETFVSQKDQQLLIDRITRMESRTEGAGSTWVTIGATAGPLLGFASFCIALAMFITARGTAKARA
jgi:hypothetical protein